MALANTDFIPPHVQLVTSQSQVVLPHGWRTAVNHEGKIYYQNDITQQTSWDLPATAIIRQTQPIHPTHPTQPTYAHAVVYNDEDDENEEDLPERKIWHYSHIILLIVFVLGIYDYYTDIQVAISFLNLASLCSPDKFKCKWTYEIAQAYIFGVPLFLFSTVGFIAALVFKCKDAKSLYLIWKYPMKRKDFTGSEAITLRRLLLWGWIPLIVEDFVSLVCTYCMSGFVGNTPELCQLYSKSMIISNISILGNALFSCKSHRQLKKLGVYLEARLCHCCWCCCVGSCAMISLVIILVMSTFAATPLVYISEEYPSTSDGIECADWSSTTEVEDRYSYSSGSNDLLRYPELLYPNCSGVDYDYSLKCDGDYDKMDVNCTLSWEYKYYDEYNHQFYWRNVSECEDVNVDNDLCEFRIGVGTCGNHTIVCDNNFVFYDGHPQIWACVDYCEP